MTPRLNPLALAIMALYACNTDAAETGAGETHGPTFSVSSFGTVGMVHSSEKNADFTSSIYKPNGAGHTHDWSANVDSLVGAQVTARFNPQLSAVVQVISEQRYDNSYRPSLEWANFKYQVTPDFSLRIGRTVQPAFLFSDSRKVGYTLPWVRPPGEVYSMIPVTSADGMDLSYRLHWGDVTNTVQGNVGQSTVKMPNDTGETRARDSWGISNLTEYGALTTRVTFQQTHLTYEPFNPLFDDFRQFGEQGNDIADRYDPKDKRYDFIGLGAIYDPGDWFIMGEWGHLRSHAVFGEMSAWYVSGGYRINAFTPYVTYARSKTLSETSTDGLDASSLPPELAGPAGELNGALNGILGSGSRQQTWSLGVRWDFAPNMDAKLQYDHTRLGNNTTGPLTNFQADFEPGGSFSLISLAVDFVF
ncbi:MULTISPECIES: porin [Pseudomonas]|uniref:porin n=1 Tax=Pseudomonas TaxID=286 RepID=UPI001BE753B9|nr:MULTISPECIES: porin [Pseudomonas]MBT2338417.1 porin [Pseudomonas fluorescens]MCD4531119.1 porin [Pseudomonas sp. C3-2018]